MRWIELKEVAKDSSEPFFKYVLRIRKQERKDLSGYLDIFINFKGNNHNGPGSKGPNKYPESIEQI